MTAQTGKPTSRTHRRRKGSAHATPRNGKRGFLVSGLAVSAALTGVGCAVVAGLPADLEDSLTEADPGARAERSAPTEPRPVDTRPSNSPSPSPSSSPTGSPSPQDLPQNGPGTFTTASGGSAKAGEGTALRYRVDVEDGINLSPSETAEQVERILGDPRGWTADGHSAFQRVASGPTDFVVKVATPGTVDEICGQYGLDTGGDLNCSVAQNVMVNLERWVRATPVYAKDVTAYRALVINHEVGHFLGHGHVTCPGEGEPAPAMMQQIKGMHGCVPNVWPYDFEGRLITGPAAP
ncbi:DUF3152 domain-containing protein [Streptomyces sp. NPDC088387]|uniref:DUF3152 domain-containing protein n=1 Tax=Streptomyces sp. NPDC088387 TaxID=3365859 RepID=UPI0037FCE03D